MASVAEFAYSILFFGSKNPELSRHAVDFSTNKNTYNISKAKGILGYQPTDKIEQELERIYGMGDAAASQSRLEGSCRRSYVVYALSYSGCLRTVPSILIIRLNTQLKFKSHSQILQVTPLTHISTFLYSRIMSPNRKRLFVKERISLRHKYYLTKYDDILMCQLRGSSGVRGKITYKGSSSQKVG